MKTVHPQVYWGGATPVSLSSYDNAIDTDFQFQLDNIQRNSNFLLWLCGITFDDDNPPEPNEFSFPSEAIEYSKINLPSSDEYLTWNDFRLMSAKKQEGYKNDIVDMGSAGIWMTYNFGDSDFPNDNHSITGKGSKCNYETLKEGYDTVPPADDPIFVGTQGLFRLPTKQEFEQLVSTSLVIASCRIDDVPSLTFISKETNNTLVLPYVNSEILSSSSYPVCRYKTSTIDNNKVYYFDIDRVPITDYVGLHHILGFNYWEKIIYDKWKKYDRFFSINSGATGRDTIIPEKVKQMRGILNL